VSESQQLDFIKAAQAIAEGQSLHEKAGLSKDFMRLLYALAVGHYESGRYIDALDPLEQLTFLDGRNADNWALLGNCMMRLGRFPEAVTAWRVAMSAAPSFSTATTVVRTAIALKDAEASAEALMVARRYRTTPAQHAEYQALVDSWNQMAGVAVD
jgi:Flp pilus assembly protein TadD